MLGHTHLQTHLQTHTHTLQKYTVLVSMIQVGNTAATVDLVGERPHCIPFDTHTSVEKNTSHKTQHIHSLSLCTQSFPLLVYTIIPSPCLPTLAILVYPP